MAPLKKEEIHENVERWPQPLEKHPEMLISRKGREYKVQNVKHLLFPGWVPPT